MKVRTIFLVNVIWVIVLMFLLIVLLLSILLKYTLNGEVLIGAITNFSTILSIILSITSIFFAFYTSRDTSAQYRNMDKALNEIRLTNKNMEANNLYLLQQVNNLAIGINTLSVRMENKTSNTTTEMNADFTSQNIQLKGNQKIQETK